MRRPIAITSDLPAPVMAAALMQQPLHQPWPSHAARQQQQNNGFPEFQPKGQGNGQMGDAMEGDRAHSLSAYLERAGRAGDLPGRAGRTGDLPGRAGLAGDLPGAQVHQLDEVRARRQQQS